MIIIKIGWTKTCGAKVTNTERLNASATVVSDVWHYIEHTLHLDLGVVRRL